LREITRAELTAPAVVLRIDLSESGHNERTSVPLDGFRSAWCVAVSDGPPAVTYWDVSNDSVARLSEFAPTPRERVAGQEPVTPIGGRLAVAICTRRNELGLRRTLESLVDQTDRDFAVFVVDNAPGQSSVRDVLDAFERLDVTYVAAPRPGLSNARNRALEAVTAEYLGWLDDDESADSTWIASLKLGFGHPSRPAAVTGTMQPRELRTSAQVLFEQYGGFTKGRGLEPVVLRRGAPSVRSPLYPLPNFGAGGNMAFRTSVLRDIGGFDPALGAGTRTFGGEETKALASLLRRGETILYWPQAITWHEHRHTIDELEKQFYGYAAGLSAFYASMLKTDPACVVDVLRLVPRGLADIAGNRRGGRRTSDLPPDFPEQLLKASRRGLLSGAWRYAVESLSARSAGPV
jgi:glycosyltransferase involved in cell wall biosynthesis